MGVFRIHVEKYRFWEGLAQAANYIKLNMPEGHKMNKRLKRHTAKYTILLFTLIIAALTGCKSNARMEPSEDVKYMEEDGDQVKDDAVIAKADETAAPEPETLNDLEKPETDLEADLEREPSEMEIYGGFLDGEIMVEKEAEESVYFSDDGIMIVEGEKSAYIDELFWDNDVEYCFADIDGDGSEELHIRDSMVYYMIKVKVEKPQIVFESWWGYEPVVMGEQRGILFLDSEYGDERINFIKISPDGSQESDGMFSWGDSNHNGSIDEEDSASVDHKGIDVEQYVRYREEQVAKQAGNELKWRGRRLKSFATWKEAYINFINKLHVTEGYDGDFEYSLIYVDDDDIPELYIFTQVMCSGEIVVSFYDGKIRSMNRDRVGIAYIEYGGLLYNRTGAMGSYPCNIYMLEKGEFTEIGTGCEYEHQDEQNIYYVYFWEGKEVTEEEYMKHINNLIDTSKCVEPSVLYSKDEMLEMLAD